MKRASSLLLAAMLLLTLCGCGNTYCTDENLICQLKNDGHTPEFILDGEYFTLPVPVSDFTDRGWVLDLSNIDDGLRPKDVVLEPGMCAWVELIKDERELNVRILNDTDAKATLDNGSVIRLQAWKQDGAADSLVLSYGITLNTSFRDANKAIQELTGYDEINKSTVGLTTVSERDSDYSWLEIRKDGSGLGFVTVASDNWIDYTEYETPANLEEQIRVFREECKARVQEDMTLYEGKYSALVEDLQKGTITDQDTIYYTFSGTVDEIVYTKMALLAGTFTEGSKTYLMTGDDGNRYAVQALDLILEPGEEVTLWGSMVNDGSALLKLEDGSLIPILNPLIAEQLGTEIYQNRG